MADRINGHAGRVAHLLSQTEARVTRELSRILAAETCTVEQWRALALLADGRSHSMSEIADFAVVPLPSLTRLIDRLVAENLAYRQPDAEDRRRVLVHASERGRDYYARICRLIEDEQDAVFEAADWTGLAELTRYLDGQLEPS